MKQLSKFLKESLKSDKDIKDLLNSIDLKELDKEQQEIVKFDIKNCKTVSSDVLSFSWEETYAELDDQIDDYIDVESDFADVLDGKSDNIIYSYGSDYYLILSKKGTILFTPDSDKPIIDKDLIIDKDNIDFAGYVDDYSAEEVSDDWYQIYDIDDDFVDKYNLEYSDIFDNCLDIKNAVVMKIYGSKKN